MSIKNLQGKLEFLREAEKLKDVLRTAHTSSGRNESTAEHSWRLCLMAITFEAELGDLDFVRVLKMCVIHDLGEALHGDVPATEQHACPNKSEQERRDLVILTRALDASTQDGILSLWDEYDNAASPEARAVKALDKLETLLQHNQGKNPEDFDYEFNLGYGRKYTDATALFKALRAMIDDETRFNMNKESRTPSPRIRAELPADVPAIEQLTVAAFEHAPHTNGAEHFIVNALRRARQLSISLVAQDDEGIVGHIALSPVSISDGAAGWYGLGPVSVLPRHQGRGIGSQLMEAALAELQRLGASGCVVLGDPAYYGRFGFTATPRLVLPGVPPEYFQAILLGGVWPAGNVTYHEAFNATA